MAEPDDDSPLATPTFPCWDPADEAARLLALPVPNGIAGIPHRTAHLLAHYRVAPLPTLMGALVMIARGREAKQPIQWGKLGLRFDDAPEFKAALETILRGTDRRLAHWREASSNPRLVGGLHPLIKVQEYEALARAAQACLANFDGDDTPKRGRGAPTTTTPDDARFIARMLYDSFIAAGVPPPSFRGARTRGALLVRELLALAYGKPPAASAVHSALREIL